MEDFGERTLDLEENAGFFFRSKNAMFKTKHVTSILETFKLIVKGRVYMVRAKELFTWNPTFLEYKEREYSLMMNGVPETIFGSSSLVPNHRDEDKDAAHSDDPFGLYDLLKNKKVDSNKTFSGQKLSKRVAQFWNVMEDSTSRVGQVMGYSMEGCVKDLENIIGKQGEDNVIR
ncbi:hypothetical protein Tco_0516191 [Tanacetum coccineum]